jgi:hypothetical protein
MACCKEHPVKAFSLTLASTGKYIPPWFLFFVVHFGEGDIRASRFNHIGSDNSDMRDGKGNYILL